MAKLLPKVLSNGIRVWSHYNQTPLVAIGVLIDAGTRDEGPMMKGAAQLIRHNAFMSTKNRTSERMSKEISALGGQFSCQHSREHIMYSAFVFAHDVPQALDIIADTIRNPNFTPQEVEEQKQVAMYEYSTLYEKPEVWMPEMVHRVAYKGSDLENSPVCEPEDLDLATPNMLQDFKNKFYTPSKIIVASTGLPPDEFETLVENSFGDLKETNPRSSILSRKKAIYKGGDLLIPGETTKTYLNIAFHSVPFTSKQLYAAATLQLLMGGGGSFSAGGPGKGMKSRLYTNVLNQYGFVQSAIATNTCYSDTGLFNFYIEVDEHSWKTIQVLSAELLSLVTIPVPEDELTRAKNQLKSLLLMNLEAKSLQLEDILKQLQLTQKCMSGKEMCEEIDAVTSQDLQNLSRTVLTSPPSIVAYGNLSRFPNDLSRNLNEFLLVKSTPKQ